MALTLGFLSIFCLVFLDPILAVQLVDIGMDKENVGFAFAIMCASFALSSPLAGLLCQKVPRPVVIMVGCAAMVPSLMITGPSKILGTNMTVTQIFIGLALIGACVGLIYTPTLPELVETVQAKFGKKYRP